MVGHQPQHKQIKSKCRTGGCHPSSFQNETLPVEASRMRVTGLRTVFPGVMITLEPIIALELGQGMTNLAKARGVRLGIIVTAV